MIKLFLCSFQFCCSKEVLSKIFNIMSELHTNPAIVKHGIFKAWLKMILKT